MIKNKIKHAVKSFFIKVLKILPPVIQIFPLEALRTNKININNVQILYQPLSELSDRRWRAFERNGKEENTFNWINNFLDNKVFFDIGANIGVFSIYSALKKKAKVYSFEPEPNSFIELFNTSELNNCQITPMLIPLDNTNNVNFLNLKNKFVPGKSGHKFGIQDSNKKNFGISGFKLDDIVFEKKIPLPDYIKIDVDGLEKNVLQGMKKILEHDNLRSILIEFSNKEEIDFYKVDLKKNRFDLVCGPTGENRNYLFSRHFE